jgi:hypothetical protein
MSVKTGVLNQDEHRSPSDDEPLSRTDRFFIMSMLADEHRTRVSLSEDTIIGGSTLSSIMELGRNELCNDLKLEDPFESIHVVCLLNLQKSHRTASMKYKRTRRNCTLEPSISDSDSRLLTPLFSIMIGWKGAGLKQILSYQASASLCHLHPIRWYMALRSKINLIPS